MTPVGLKCSLWSLSCLLYTSVSQDLKDNIEDAYIYTDIMGSDHCPVGVQLEGLE